MVSIIVPVTKNFLFHRNYHFLLFWCSDCDGNLIKICIAASWSLYLMKLQYIEILMVQMLQHWGGIFICKYRAISIYQMSERMTWCINEFLGLLHLCVWQLYIQGQEAGKERMLFYRHDKLLPLNKAKIQVERFGGVKLLTHAIFVFYHPEWWPCK